MISRLKAVIIREDGMTTAEYAVGTVAAAGFGGLLIKLLSSPEIARMVLAIFERALGSLFGG